MSINKNWIYLKNKSRLKEKSMNKKLNKFKMKALIFKNSNKFNKRMKN